MVKRGTANTTDKEDTVSRKSISLISVISRFPFSSIWALSHARFPLGSSSPKVARSANVVLEKLYPVYSKSSCNFSGVYFVISLPNFAKKPSVLIPFPLKEGFEASLCYYCRLYAADAPLFLHPEQHHLVHKASEVLISLPE